MFDNGYDERGRRLWNIHNHRLPHSMRDAVRTVLPDEDSLIERGYIGVFGSDAADDDPRWPCSSLRSIREARAALADASTVEEARAARALHDGAECHYGLRITDDEARWFARQANVRALAPAVMHHLTTRRYIDSFGQVLR